MLSLSLLLPARHVPSGNPPAAPVIDLLDSDENFITVGWAPSAGAQSYTLEYSYNNGAWTEAAIEDIVFTLFVEATPNGLRYDFSFYRWRVTAHNAFGSTVSNLLTIRPFIEPELSSVTFNGIDGPDITWPATNQGINDITVFRAIDNGSWVQVFQYTASIGPISVDNVGVLGFADLSGAAAFVANSNVYYSVTLLNPGGGAQSAGFMMTV